MRVGELARRAGLTTRAVRLYEAEGVLPAARRTANRYRSYTEQDLELLRFVARLRAVGLRLSEIREVVRLRARGVPPPERVIALLEGELARLDRSLDLLRQKRCRLADVLHQAQSRAGQGLVVHLCRLVAESEPDG
jgi:MerR family transcriptional regulator, copper efflux regulator